MAQELLTERHPEQIAGVISCWDRVVIRGMLTTLGCPDGMTAYLSARGIRIFDFQEFAKPLTASVKAHAERLAAGAGLEINYIRKKQFGDSGAQAEASGGALLSAACRRWAWGPAAVCWKSNRPPASCFGDGRIWRRFRRGCRARRSTACRPKTS